jgi:hypothetical protein
VQQAARALSDEAHLRPLKLSQAHAHGHGALRIADLPGQRGLQ